ncbi:unnamed protein product, partial [Microthlaspi erraticum]
VFWSTLEHWDVRSKEGLGAWTQLSHTRKDEGGSHLEASSTTTRPTGRVPQLDRAEESTVKPEKCCFPFDSPLTLNLILLYLKA